MNRIFEWVKVVILLTYNWKIKRYNTKLELGEENQKISN